MIVDHAKDPSSPTGEFELIHCCPIGRYYPPQKVQLNIDGKRINPPPKHNGKSLFRLKNFSDLMVKGEKLFKPLKARLGRTPMEMKAISAEEIARNERKSSLTRKNYNRVRPLKILRSPIRPRNIFHTIVMKPPSTSESDDATGYVRKLPTELKSQKIVNLNDLMRYLKINENLL